MEKYIIFEGKIEQQPAHQLVNSILSAETQNVSKINIIFSSLGGSIYEGFIIASVIQNSKIPVEIHAVNHIDSIANVIYLSAKKRTSESYAKFYLHGAAIGGNFDEKALNDQLSSIKTNNLRIANFVSENSNLSVKKVQSMMEIGTTISALTGLTYGMVHEICHKEVPEICIRENIIYVN
jgi:ATP-dependent protease ClpP protease subunit